MFVLVNSLEPLQIKLAWFPGFSPENVSLVLRFQCHLSRFSGTNKMRWLHSFPPCWTSVQHCQIVKMCRGLEIVYQPLRLRQSLEEGLRYLGVLLGWKFEIGHNMFILWHCNFSHINKILFLARGVWTEFRRFENHPQLATSKVMIVPCLLVKGRRRYVFLGVPSGPPDLDTHEPGWGKGLLHIARSKELGLVFPRRILIALVVSGSLEMN